MAVYKVSYVVIGKNHPGSILNQDHQPQTGEKIRLGKDEFEIIEVLELVPPRGDFHYMHATCRPVQKSKKKA